MRDVHGSALIHIDDRKRIGTLIASQMVDCGFDTISSDDVKRFSTKNPSVAGLVASICERAHVPFGLSGRAIASCLRCVDAVNDKVKLVAVGAVDPNGKPSAGGPTRFRFVGINPTAVATKTVAKTESAVVDPVVDAIDRAADRIVGAIKSLAELWK